MIKIGIAGIGFMGMIHFLAAQKAKGVKVTAIQSRDERKRSGDWRGVQGNFGPPGTMMDLGDIHRHEKFIDLIEDPDVDLIDLTVPTPQHEAMAIAALASGKHVLVEKPIALDVAAAERMLTAASQNHRMLLVGHVLPCFPEFRFVLEATRTQKFGNLLAGQFLRVISKPDWSAAMADMTATGGPAIDLHIHDTHFIRTLAGQPSEVIAIGHEADGVVQHLSTLYRYDSGPSLSCTCGALAAKARPFAHSFELYFERATLVFGPGQPLVVLHENGSTEAVSVESDPVAAFVYELEKAAAGVVAGAADPFLAGGNARDALVLCHKEIESVRLRQPVRL